MRNPARVLFRRANGTRTFFFCVGEKGMLMRASARVLTAFISFTSFGVIALALAGCQGGSQIPAPSIPQSEGRQAAGAQVAIAGSQSAKIRSIAVLLSHAALPLGQSETLSVSAMNKNGTVIQGTYDNPIQLTGQNLTFSNATIENSQQAASVTITWNPRLRSFPAVQVTASADGASGTAQLQPASGFQYFATGDNPIDDHGAYQMTLGPDGKLYYLTEGPPSECLKSPPVCIPAEGAVGRFDPDSFTGTQVELHSGVSGLAFSSDGALWVSSGITAATAGGRDGLLYRFPPGSFSANSVEKIYVPNPTGSSRFQVRDLAQDGSGNMWFTTGGASELMSIPVAGPYKTSAISVYSTPNGPPGTQGIFEYTGGIAFASDGNLYVADYFNGDLDQVNPANGSVTAQFVTPEQQSLGSSDTTQPRSVVNTSRGQLALTQLGPSSSTTAQGDVDEFDPASGGFTRVPMPFSPSGFEPDTIASSGTAAYFTDIIDGLGYFNEAKRESRIYPNGIVVANYSSQPPQTPDGVAVVNENEAWFTCFGDYLPQQCIGRVRYLPLWGLHPAQDFAITVGPTNAQLVGIMEAPSANSGPFSISNSQPGTCTVSHQTNHNFVVSGGAAGTCAITVTDNRSRTATINVTVLSAAGSSSERRPTTQ